MMPKRREKGLLTEVLPTETIVYDTTNHKVHCLNALARLVWQHCDGRTSEAKMVAILRNELHIEADKTLVGLARAQLAAAGLLTDQPPAGTRTTRRAASLALARVGLAAAAALVATVAAPAVAQAASAGKPCTTNDECSPPNPCCCNGNSGGLKKTCQRDETACRGAGDRGGCRKF